MATTHHLSKQTQIRRIVRQVYRRPGLKPRARKLRYRITRDGCQISFYEVVWLFQSISDLANPPTTMFVSSSFNWETQRSNIFWVYEWNYLEKDLSKLFHKIWTKKVWCSVSELCMKTIAYIGFKIIFPKGILLKYSNSKCGITSGMPV